MKDEQYLLDFLDNRQKNSRLSCQINVTDKLDGMVITVPEQTLIIDPRQGHQLAVTWRFPFKRWLRASPTLL